MTKSHLRDSFADTSVPPGPRLHGPRAVRRLAAGLLGTFVCAAIVPGLALCAGPACPSPPPPGCSSHTPIAHAQIERLVRRGAPVSLTCRRIDGGLDLRRAGGVVRAPFVIRSSIVEGGLDAPSTTFGSVVDLYGTTLEGPANFYAAEFNREADFPFARFNGGATFLAAEFHGATDFSSACFAKQANLATTSFGNTVDFSNAYFQTNAVFDSAHLAGQARFTSATFAADALFRVAQFGAGADFSNSTFRAAADFADSAAQGDLGFQRVQFLGSALPGEISGASFYGALFGGHADFSDAGAIGGANVFGDAVIHSLDLSGDQLDLGAPTHIDELSIDPSAVAPQTAWDYGQLESAASSAGDLAAANEARVLRLGQARKSETPIVRAFDWAFAWGVGGYLVRPWHPAFALLALFLIGVLARTLAHRRERHGFRAILDGLGNDVNGAFRSFRRIKPDGRANLVAIESFAYTVLTVVLLVNLEGVSSGIHSLVQGIV